MGPEADENKAGSERSDIKKYDRFLELYYKQRQIRISRIHKCRCLFLSKYYKDSTFLKE